MVIFSSKNSCYTLGFKKNQTKKLSQNLKGFLYQYTNPENNSDVQKDQEYAILGH